MRRTISGFAIILGIMAIAAAAPAEAAADSGDNVGLYMARDVDHHLYLARAYFLGGKNEASADEVRKAISFMSLEEERAGGKKEEDVDASIREMRKLADDIEKGKVGSEKELNRAFSRAHHAMAEHYYMAASRAWKQKDAKKTGNALEAALVHLKLALIWADYQGEEMVARIEKDGALAAEKLLGAGDLGEEEVSKIIQELGKALSDYRTVVKPSDKK